MIIAILAWSGAALSCLLTIPQALRTLQMDRLDAISAITYWIVLGNAVIWAAWSVLTQQYAAGVPALVNGPAAILILRRLHRSHRAAATAAGEPRQRCPRRAPAHRVPGETAMEARWAPWSVLRWVRQRPVVTRPSSSPTPAACREALRAWRWRPPSRARSGEAHRPGSASSTGLQVRRLTEEPHDRPWCLRVRAHKSRAGGTRTRDPRIMSPLL